MEKKLLKLIAHHAGALSAILEDHPELSGYADSELGKKALGNFLKELYEIQYHAEAETYL